MPADVVEEQINAEADQNETDAIIAEEIAKNPWTDMKRLPKDERPHREGFFELMTRLKNQSDDDKQLKDEEKIKLDKKDIVALFLSAFFTLFLPVVIFLVGIVCLVMALFGFSDSRKKTFTIFQKASRKSSKKKDFPWCFFII